MGVGAAAARQVRARGRVGVARGAPPASAARHPATHSPTHARPPAHGPTGDSNQPMDPKIAAMLAAAGRALDSFPPDFAAALLSNRVRRSASCACAAKARVGACSGRRPRGLEVHARGRTAHAAPCSPSQVTPEILKRYLELEANFFIKFVWGIQGDDARPALHAPC